MYLDGQDELHYAQLIRTFPFLNDLQSPVCGWPDQRRSGVPAAGRSRAVLAVHAVRYEGPLEIRRIAGPERSRLLGKPSKDPFGILTLLGGKVLLAASQAALSPNKGDGACTNACLQAAVARVGGLPLPLSGDPRQQSTRTAMIRLTQRIIGAGTRSGTRLHFRCGATAYGVECRRKASGTMRMEPSWLLYSVIKGGTVTSPSQRAGVRQPRSGRSKAEPAASYSGGLSCTHLRSKCALFPEHSPHAAACSRSGNSAAWPVAMSERQGYWIHARIQARVAILPRCRDSWQVSARRIDEKSCTHVRASVRNVRFSSLWIETFAFCVHTTACRRTIRQKAGRRSCDWSCAGPLCRVSARVTCIRAMHVHCSSSSPTSPLALRLQL